MRHAVVVRKHEHDIGSLCGSLQGRRPHCRGQFTPVEFHSHTRYHRRRLVRYAGGVNRRTFLGASLLPAGRVLPAQLRPNIVWIWADNLAYADLGVYGGADSRTPVIDQLAREGVRFAQFYVAHTVCSPSRAALLTGRQPFRAGVVDVLRPDSPTGLPASEITIAEILRRQGYRTQAIGKWHLGDRREYLPTRRGFHHYFGLPYSMDMLPTHLYRDEEIIDDMAGGKVENYTERLTDESIRFVESAARSRKPYFLYFSHTIPHPPLNLPARLRHDGRTIYQDAIEHMDAETGRLLQAIGRVSDPGNTLVIFTSDNGPMDNRGNTGGLRGRIRDAHEGGLRVPFIANWRGRLPAGKVVDTPAIMYDAMPTIAGLTGARLPTDRVYDGQDIWPLLTGQGPVARQQPFVWVYLDNVEALRDGRWKLHLSARERRLERPQLYDLDTDAGESTDVAAQHPDIVEGLVKFAKEFEGRVPKVWSLQYPVLDTRKLPSGPRRR